MNYKRSGVWGYMLHNKKSLVLMSSILQKNWISFQPFILNNVFKRTPPPPRPPPLPQICYLRLPQTPGTWGWPLPRCSSTSSTMSTWPLTGEQHDCFQLKSIVARYSELHKIQPFRKHLFSYFQIQEFKTSQN